MLLGLAGFAAGVINAIAGGGSLVSFPALLHTGMGSVTANATNTLAVWPGSVASAVAYRRFIVGERHRALALAWPSLLGGLAGSWLLLHTSERAFDRVVPWLIVLACALLLLQGPVGRLVARQGPGAREGVPASLALAQLLISVYGGYFGAGMGILMLASMAIFIPAGLQAANGLKLFCACIVNGVAVVYFLVRGAARVPEASLMAAASILGGWAGAHLAQRLPGRVVRALVVTYGLAVAWKLLHR